MSNQQRKIYDFKSVGLTEEKRLEISNQVPVRKPIGIKTPMTLSTDHSEVFAMHTVLRDQIKDNFRNMIMTNHGERMWHYDFGGNLAALSFELGTDEVDSEAIRRISATTNKYMPFISLETFEVNSEFAENESLAKVVVRVTYGVPSINVTNQVVEAVIYAAS